MVCVYVSLCQKQLWLHLPCLNNCSLLCASHITSPTYPFYFAPITHRDVQPQSSGTHATNARHLSMQYIHTRTHKPVHAEMASLNAVARTLVRILFGAALMQGSYPDASHHFESACTLSPKCLVHRVELGRTLAKASGSVLFVCVCVCDLACTCGSHYIERLIVPQTRCVCWPTQCLKSHPDV